MANLLNLPHELLDIIIQHVISLPSRAPPLSPSPSSEGVAQDCRAEPRDTSCLSWTRGLGIEYQTDPACYHSNTYGLLLANRRLSAETRRHIERVRSAGEVNYILDVMVVGDGEFRPTWTYLPFISRRVDVLEVRFRLFTDPVLRGHMFRSVNGRTDFNWALYSLLERFVALGPMAPGEKVLLRDPEARTTIEGVGIGSLSLVVSTDIGDDEPKFNRGLEIFMTSLRGWVSDFQLITPITAVYATLLYEFFDRIELRHNDREIETFDLGRPANLVVYGEELTVSRLHLLGFGLFDGGMIKSMSAFDWESVIWRVRARKGLATC